MKTLRVVGAGRIPVLSAVVFLFQTATFAQTVGGGSVPVVTIHADQPIASITPSGANSPGVFTVTRWGDTNLTLNVYYQIGGTASNGVDYTQISNWVTIPAGATSNSIVITSLHTSPGMADKTVVLQLVPTPVTTPTNYEIGTPDGAVVYVTGVYTNPVPWVKIVTPTNDEVFSASAHILIEAVAGEEGFSFPRESRYVTRVQFFAGTNYLGGFADAPPWMTWPQPQIVWSNPPAGNFVLTAVAIDNAGISATSPPVNIVVQQSSLGVSILSPKDGQVFYTPTNIQLLAKATDLIGSVTNVEFFAGAEDLGSGQMLVLDPPGIGGVVGPVYLFTWMNVPTGNYPLTATATDNQGLSVTSAVVNIAVLQGPPTNLPPVVRMVVPPDGAVFRAPVNLPLFAFARDPDSSLTSVEFFAGTNSLGFGQPVRYVLPLPPGPVQPPIIVVAPTNYWELIWTNPMPATNILLTALATDAAGLSATSAPVNITVLPLPPPPPPTNRPPVVNIVATDPVAIEGTNFWVWQGETNLLPTWASWPPAVCRWFTNFAPQTAAFTVRRFGDTNGDLSIPYDISGTASNGVDYVQLPGFVTIPAGERYAFITVVPIDDGPPDVNKTVVLGLQSSTNAPPDYLVGYPARAAAIIIDGAGPHPLTGIVPGGSFHFAATGPDAAWFCIQYSTDLIHWTSICTNQVVNGSIDFVDPDASNNSTRFYRIQPLAVAPPE